MHADAVSNHGPELRWDAIERVLEDAVQRNGVNLQLIGQLATMLGLHAVGGQMQPNQARQLQTPSIVRTGGSIARQSRTKPAVVGLSAGYWRESAWKVSRDITSVLMSHWWNAPAQLRNNGSTKLVFASNPTAPECLDSGARSIVCCATAHYHPLLIQVIIDKVIANEVSILPCWVLR